MACDNPVCVNCVTDELLKAWVKEKGALATCAYCEHEEVCCSIEAVAHKIDEAIRQYYQLAPEEGHVTPESDNIVYYAEGPTAEEIIHDIVDPEEAVADIVDVLSEHEAYDVRDGADALYDDSPLRHIRAYPDRFLEIWTQFERRLKHEVRFFDEEGRRMLDELFGDLAGFGGGRAIVTLTPDEADLKLYRARIVTDETEAEDFLRDPARHIGPPPPKLARAGRMNPSGIPAFYGAFSADVALAEIRPPVGALVAIGEFSLLKPVKLLDMSFLPFAYHDESIFSAKYDEARDKVKFLEVFHRRISRPVLPSDETLAYLPTQAVGAYVTNVMKLDGIIHSSTQVGAEGESTGDQLPRVLCNVVLFGSAAHVEHTPAPPRPPEPPPFDDEPAIFPIFGRRNLAPKAEHQAVLDANQSTLEPTSTTASAPAAADQKQSVIPEPNGLTASGVPATLRVKRDPELVRVRAVKVETSGLFAHLYEDGKVLIDDFSDHDE